MKFLYVKVKEYKGKGIECGYIYDWIVWEMRVGDDKVFCDMF